MNGRAWTTAEDRKLRKLYRTQTAAECAASLDRSVSAVQQRVGLLGLFKSDEWIAECTRRRWAEGRHENSRAACFKPGQAPANKGRPQAEWMPAASRKVCAKTQFRKGHLGGAAAAKRQPIGTLRIADGQLQKKMHDGLPYMSRWVAVQRLVWEAANGPIPPGHVVVFRDGRTRTKEDEITLGVLELVTRAENMRRNSRHTRYPPEVNQLIQLKGALNRKINARSKQE